MVAAIKAMPIEMDAQRHDHVVAAISHLPYLISSALVATVAQQGKETGCPVTRMLCLLKLGCQPPHLDFLLHFLEVLFDRDFRNVHGRLTFPDVLIALEYCKGETQNIRFLRSNLQAAGKQKAPHK